MSREFTVTGIRMAALRKGILISADRWGKLKTIFQMSMMGLGGLIWVNNWDIRKLDLPGTEISLYVIWWVLLVVILLLTIFSGWGYFRQFSRMVKNLD
jgi:CDP-diacylglycerol--glycerol-3-phosphate 3-phosphatidyltransferase